MGERQKLSSEAFFIKSAGGRRALHSFPTRRSSDLQEDRENCAAIPGTETDATSGSSSTSPSRSDRKSTRLNSSHVEISYAVFCLKKKTLESYWQYEAYPVSLTSQSVEPSRPSTGCV